MYQGNPHAVAFWNVGADPCVCPYALRRDAVSCKPRPKSQPPKLHPQIGYRRFTPARGPSKNFLDIYVHFCYNYHVGH